MVVTANEITDEKQHCSGQELRNWVLPAMAMLKMVVFARMAQVVTIAINARQMLQSGLIMQHPTAMSANMCTIHT